MPRIDICKDLTTEKDRLCLEGSLPEILTLITICIKELAERTCLPKELIIGALATCIENENEITKMEGIN